MALRCIQGTLQSPGMKDWLSMSFLAQLCSQELLPIPLTLTT